MQNNQCNLDTGQEVVCVGEETDGSPEHSPREGDSGHQEQAEDVQGDVGVPVRLSYMY